MLPTEEQIISPYPCFAIQRAELNSLARTSDRPDHLNNQIGGSVRYPDAKMESQRDFIHQPRVGEPASLPWLTRLIFSQPQPGCITPATKRSNPVGVENHFELLTQGSRSAPTMGWMTLPRWGTSSALRLRSGISKVSIYGVFTPLIATSKRDIF